VRQWFGRFFSSCVRFSLIQYHRGDNSIKIIVMFIFIVIVCFCVLYLLHIFILRRMCLYIDKQWFGQCLWHVRPKFLFILNLIFLSSCPCLHSVTRSYLLRPHFLAPNTSATRLVSHKPLLTVAASLTLLTYGQLSGFIGLPLARRHRFRRARRRRLAPTHTHVAAATHGGFRKTNGLVVLFSPNIEYFGLTHFNSYFFYP
jgi:hypothetical protein